ncbi:nuclear condensing complex subunit, partial [Endogone sp. FLAS-F59071]
MLATCLEQYEIPGLQAIAVEGISKLMLSKMLRDEELLKQLVLLYFDPDTADNLKLRQCLSYFLPMYCHSSQDNQVLMQKILVPTILSLIQMHHDLSKEQEMVAPPQIIQMMVDWTDPRRVVLSRLNPDAAKAIDLGLHAEVAVDVLKALFIETVATTRKLLVQILNKLYIDEAGEIRLKKLTMLAGNLKSRKPLTDAMTRNMFNKFEAALLKFFENKPEALDDDEIEQVEEYKELLDFVESVED